jgi:U4/U6 small nuclear ribonucleoprotein PRP31
MSLLMTATNTKGVQLTDSQWNTVEKACDMADRLEDVKRKVSDRPHQRLKPDLTAGLDF